MKELRQLFLPCALGIAMLIVALWAGSFAWLAQLLGFMGVANGAQLLAEYRPKLQRTVRFAVGAVAAAVLLKLLGMVPAASAYRGWETPIVLLMDAVVLTCLCAQLAALLGGGWRFTCWVGALPGAVGVLAALVQWHGYKLACEPAVSVLLLAALIWILAAYRRFHQQGGLKMKVLVIGGGGREHAIVHTLKKSPKVDHIWCAPGNGGIAEEAECVDLKATDIDGVVAFAKANQPDLVMVAPDDPLALGMVDALEAAGFRAFGPRKNAAVIEGSKSFAKELMEKYNIPTAGYAVFENSAEAIEYIRKNGAPIVIKADGLALGKGVTVAMTEEEAIEAVKDAIDGGSFGAAGARVVIEEFLTGPEVSVLAFVDGKTLKTMPSAQDHKRAYDHDEGPNTGGMGAFSPSRFYTDEIAATCMETIFKPTVAAMAQEGRPFKGVLYFGLMLTPKGPKVIEYNARFGDPETQAVLSRLDSDLYDIFNAVIDEKLDQIDIKWADNAACCVCMASGGYPGAYEKGKEIAGLDQVTDSIVFHAGTAVKDGKLVTAGGRVLGVTAVADTLDEAIRKAYADVKKIHFDQAHYRTDIGVK